MSPTVDEVLAAANKGGNKPTFGVLSAKREGIGALPSASVLCVAAPSLCVAVAAASPSVQPVFTELENWGGALPSATVLCVAAPSPSAQPVALAPVLPLLTALCVVVPLAPVDAALATALCGAAPSPSVQPVELAPVLPLLTALRIVVQLMLRWRYWGQAADA